VPYRVTFFAQLPIVLAIELMRLPEERELRQKIDSWQTWKLQRQREDPAGVRQGDGDIAARHAPQLSQRLWYVLPLDMLEHFGCERQVELPVLQWQCGYGADDVGP